MRAHEIIRAVLDLIDHHEEPEQEPVTAVVTVNGELPMQSNDDELLSRLQQIAGLMGDKPTGEMSPLSNAPNERYAGLDAVTATGDDINKSKHPSDIRGDHVSMYPNHQHRPE